MAQSAGLHEAAEKLAPTTVDRHRALASIQEELEAVDWYDQRVDATDDPELAAVLAHNRDEEKEHAAMTADPSVRSGSSSHFWFHSSSGGYHGGK